MTLSPFKANMEISDVLLPIAPFTETSGTFVNAEGRVQSFHAVVKPLAETRPAWKVLRVLANLLGVQGVDYESSQDVLTTAIGTGTERSPSQRVEQRHQGGCASHRRSGGRACSGKHLSTGQHCPPCDIAAIDSRCARGTSGRCRMIDQLKIGRRRPGGCGLVDRGGVACDMDSAGHHRHRGTFDDCRGLPDFVGAQVSGWIQVRPGPNRVGPWGLLQPMADGLKLLTKELIMPTVAAKGLFYVGPVDGDHAGLGCLGGDALWS